MIRSFTLIAAALACCIAQGQLPIKIITLPALDTTASRTAFIKKPGDGYLIATRQTGAVDWGSTMVEIDDTGEPQSAMRIQENILKVILCADSGYLMLGYNALIKTDPDLNIQWAKHMAMAWPTWWTNEIAEHEGYYYMFSDVPEQMFDPDLAFFGTYAAIITKFDGGGDLVDQVILADTVYSSSRYNLYQPQAAFGDDGSLYLSLSMLQYWAAGTCNRVPTVIKLDADLEVQWSYCYPVNIFNNVSGVGVLRDGNVALTGSYGNNYPYCTYFRNYLQKIDTDGSVLWAKSYRHPDPAGHGSFPAFELADSTIVVSRVYQDSLGAPSWPYVDHLRADGTVIGSKGFAHPYGHNNHGLLLADAGDGAIGVFRLNDWDTLLFTTIDTSLTTYCYSVPNTTLDSTVSIAREPFAPAYLSFTFNFNDTVYTPFQTVPFATLPDCDLSTAVGTAAIQDLGIFPNPSSGQVTITGPLPIIDLTITDALGRIVQRSAPHRSTVAVEIPRNGVYFVRIVDGQGEYVRKLIVEDR